jgi:hypothetical protein
MSNLCKIFRSIKGKTVLIKENLSSKHRKIYFVTVHHKTEQENKIKELMAYFIQAKTPAGAWRANNGTINDFGTVVPLASIKTLQEFEYSPAASQIWHN